MIILGIDYFFEASTACVVRDGQLIAAFVEEPSQASQQHSTLPLGAIDRCLEAADVTLSDLDGVAISIEATQDWLRESLYNVTRLDNALPVLKPQSWRAYFKQRALWEWIRDQWPQPGLRPEVYFVPHHLSHARAAFLASPFEQAAILTLEGSKEWSTSFLGHGDGTAFAQYHESHYPMSLGVFFETATEFCGLCPDADEGKTMSLAAQGDPDRFYDRVATLVTIDDRGGIGLDLSYFNFERWIYRRCSKRFISAFGPPRRFDGEFESRHIDLAAAFQRVLEERTLELCALLHERSQFRPLVFAGGVSRNGALTRRMAEDSAFEELFVMPATGKTGPAIEAAFYVYHRIMEPKRTALPDGLTVTGDIVASEMEEVIPLRMLATIPGYDLSSLLRPKSSTHSGLIWHEEKIECVTGLTKEPSTLFGIVGNNPLRVGPLAQARPQSDRLFIPAASRKDRKRLIELLEDRSLVLVITDVLPDENDPSSVFGDVGANGLGSMRPCMTDLPGRGLMERLGCLIGAHGSLKQAIRFYGDSPVVSPVNAIRCFFSRGVDSLLIGNFVGPDMVR